MGSPLYNGKIGEVKCHRGTFHSPLMKVGRGEGNEETLPYSARAEGYSMGPHMLSIAWRWNLSSGGE